MSLQSLCASPDLLVPGLPILGGKETPLAKSHDTQIYVMYCQVHLLTDPPAPIPPEGSKPGFSAVRGFIPLMVHRRLGLSKAKRNLLNVPSPVTSLCKGLHCSPSIVLSSPPTYWPHLISLSLSVCSGKPSSTCLPPHLCCSTGSTAGSTVAAPHEPPHRPAAPSSAVPAASPGIVLRVSCTLLNPVLKGFSGSPVTTCDPPHVHPAGLMACLRTGSLEAEPETEVQELLVY